VSPITHPAIERYAEQHTSAPDPLLQALADETRRTLTSPGMLTGTVEGRFLETLVFVSGARRVLEIGTYSGYSALSMAAALPADGRLITCELSEERAAVARRYFAQSPYGGRIELRLGPALETIANLEGTFDLVFIDADKVSYLAYYQATLPMLAERGLIVADNTLWSGRVAEEAGTEAADDTTRALMKFNEHVARDERVVGVMLTIRDGVTLIRRADAPSR
jgi:caffeoyl-CoA O-methyltransferase